MIDDYTDNAATFGDRLALARERQGMTSAQLARHIGLKAATIQNWEDDRSEPRANKLQMLAGFLNVSIVWLLTGEGEGSPTDLQDQPGASVQNLSEILDELRELRKLHMQIGDRMSRFEQRLREIQTGEAVQSDHGAMQ
ncbi:MAG: helix-turn-helix transcriptional regulator [Pseudomonadota bacterium]